ncbi:MAG: hypothetical protein AAGH42_12750, partial [Pseudomonadota bacterium]
KEEDVALKIIPHDGVSDLKKSLPRKLRGWANDKARFLVIRDNDRGNCKERKLELEKICEEFGKNKIVKIRIVCQELEAWYIGDLHAIYSAGFAKKAVLKKQNRGKYSDPDQIERPIEALNGITIESIDVKTQKLMFSESVAPNMNVEGNLSISFQQTVLAMKSLLNELNLPKKRS